MFDRVLYHTTPPNREERTPRFSWVWILIGALLFQFFTADKDWIRSRGRGGSKETQQEEKR